MKTWNRQVQQQNNEIHIKHEQRVRRGREGRYEQREAQTYGGMQTRQRRQNKKEETFAKHDNDREKAEEKDGKKKYWERVTNV